MAGCGAGELDIRLGDCAGLAGCIGSTTATGGVVTNDNETVLPAAEANATATIPTVRFVTQQLIVREDIGQAAVLVWLSALADQDIGVQVVAGGDGVTALGAEALPIPVVIPAGAIVQSVVIPILDNVLPDGDRTVELFLATPVGAQLEDPAHLTLTIRDNDGVAEADTILDTNAARALAAGTVTADFGGGGSCSLVQ